MIIVRQPLVFIFFWFSLFFSSHAFAVIPFEQIAKATGQQVPSLAPMLKEITPAVVNISTRSRVRVRNNPLFQDPFFRRFFNVPERPREKITQSLGSGVVVDAEQGYVITNNHVIHKADEITVTLRDGRRLLAKVVGTDPDSDVAVIQVPAKDLSAVPLANSDHLQVGDFVVAIGNPFGLGQTVTSGIVSALGRSGLGIEGYEDFIQTDASINPGNSGGALVNLHGELVGINTAIIAPAGGNVGIGFAIPVNMVNDIMQQLIEHGEVRRGRLGVYIQDLTPDLAKAFAMKQSSGAVISQIVSDSPAERAGLRAGDVIIRVDERRVSSSSDLRNLIGLLRVGQKINVSVVRSGKILDLIVEVTASEPIKTAGKNISPRLNGAELLIDEALYQNGQSGIRVQNVVPRSPAWRAGLRSGDIILSANRQQVFDFDELRQAIGQGRKSLLLNILRGDGALFLLIE